MKKGKPSAKQAKKWHPWPLVERYLGPISDEEAHIQEIESLEQYLDELALEYHKVQKKVQKLRDELLQSKEAPEEFKKAKGF